MYHIDSANAKEHSYPIYGRQFKTYRWYKPIIVTLLFVLFYTILTVALYVGIMVAINGGTFPHSVHDIPGNVFSFSYDTMDLANMWQSAVSLGGVAMMIPALWLASLIVHDRPFSSYSSSRGGWSSKVFWKAMPIAFICASVPIAVNELYFNHHLQDFHMGFTAASLVVVTVLGPLQCIAEEYVFRGLLTQTLGSWFRIPIVAIVLQAALFALAHPYDTLGKIGIFITGMVFGLAAWIGRGIEVSSAFHICNNMTIFYLQGLNMAAISTATTMKEFILDACMGAAYVLLIFIASRRHNWFSKVRHDDAAAWNGRYEEKIARKEAKAAAKAEKKAEKNAPIGTHEESAPGKHFKQ